MSISVLIISHEEIGNALVQTVTKTFHELPLPTTVVNIESHTDPEILLPKLQRLIENMGKNDGILILTDLYGATPSNIAQILKKEGHIRMICGLNLPMLMKVMNYPDLSLDELAEKQLAVGVKALLNTKTSDYAAKRTNNSKQIRLARPGFNKIS
jgi:PTS system mannose-specific IIA component